MIPRTLSGVSGHSVRTDTPPLKGVRSVRCPRPVGRSEPSSMLSSWERAARLLAGRRPRRAQRCRRSPVVVIWGTRAGRRRRRA
jgi:hypothetical protein